jgi:cold shock CspA family protein
MTGTIKKLVSDKGFGFITAEGLARKAAEIKDRCITHLA